MSSHDPYCNIERLTCPHCGKHVLSGAHSCYKRSTPTQDTPAEILRSIVGYWDSLDAVDGTPSPKSTEEYKAGLDALIDEARLLLEA